MKTLFIIVLLCVWGQNASAQQGTIEGVLFNKAEQTGFGGRATVLLPELKNGATSDENGSFRILNIPAGTYQLKVECIGYQDTTFQVNVVADEVTALNVNFPIGCHVLNHKGKTCPYCHKSDEAIPVVYGMPDERTLRRAKAGKLKLAGCNMTGCDPKWYCKRDEKKF
ncbi:carboxypeptidase-like regulatory domain-containing protein [Hymenobacter actinosclerus]|uniref:carboxypeptidase-like regulatory domain-containing protein n=1 Tax=Hymenobacter actinosclerus TaxID=82805 RepID=UPI0015A58385|nr:carboxypeptidase-like regulatory domain-containing protein [Hymenobacter actinosclerus]